MMWFRRYLPLIVLGNLWLALSVTGQTSLIQDINPGPGWSHFTLIYDRGDLLFFVALRAEGREIWQSDGSSEGTKILKDIHPGAQGSDPDQFLQLNGIWYFVANDGTHGFELWKTDWTSEGTQMIKDINPGNNSSSPEQLTIIGNELFFTAMDGQSGSELWKSDGTSAGTQQVKDIFAGSESSLPQDLTAIDGQLFFTAVHPAFGRELWSSQGSNENTNLVSDIRLGDLGSSPLQLCRVGMELYFTADDAVNGRELWKSDGSSEGTQLVENIHPGIGSSNPDNLLAIDEQLFFSADNGQNGLEFYMLNANTTVTGILNKDIHMGKDSSFPSNFMPFRDELYFNANNGLNGFELWKSDGTVEGTQLVEDIFPSFTSSNPVLLAASDNLLYFYANDGTHGFELWQTDGSGPGTSLVKDINPIAAGGDGHSFPTQAFVVDNQLYFSAFNQIKAWQIWKTTGDEMGAIMVTDFPPERVFDGLVIPFLVRAEQDTVWFVAFTEQYGEEFWKYVKVPLSFVDVSSNSPLQCFGDQNGSLQLTVGGGVGPNSLNSYEWSSNALSGPSPAGLSAGSYSVTVTDCGGQTIDTTVIISQPEQMIVNFAKVKAQVCLEGGDGQAQALVNGGVGDYQYSWDTGETSQEAQTLSKGVHSVTVTDGNGCTTSKSLSIGALEAQISSAQAVLCFGTATGSAMASVQGDTLAYQFQWDNGEANAMASMLAAGMHTVSITDSLNCSAMLAVTIQQPDSISVSFQTTEASPDSSNGSATAIPMGGIAPYSYEWRTDPLQNESTATGLAAGQYQIQITDANGCSSVFEVDIELAVSSFELASLQHFKIFPNPTASYLVIDIAMLQDIDWKLSLLDEKGALLREFYAAQKHQLFKWDLQDLPAGIYYLVFDSPEGRLTQKVIKM